MAGAGSVAWIFEKKGLVLVSKSSAGEDQLLELVLGAGAEDMTTEGESFQITTGVPDFENVRAAIEKASIPMESAQLTMIPKNQTAVDADAARSVLSLVESLEDNDDVQNVYMNADIPDEVMKEIAG